MLPFRPSLAIFPRILLVSAQLREVQLLSSANDLIPVHLRRLSKVIVRVDFLIA